MKASELTAWALALLEFEAPVELDAPASAAYPLAAQPETRVRFRFYDPEADRRRLGQPVDLVLTADDEAGAVRARLEPAVELHIGKFSSLVDLADQINRLGACCATYYDPERQRLVIQSAIRHKRRHAVGAGLADQEVGEKEATLNWLVDVMSLAREAMARVVRMTALQPDT